MLWRNAGNLDQFSAITQTTATVKATATDHTPPTADRDVAPHSSFARKDRSRRGKIAIDISKLTATTTASGSAAQTIGGVAELWYPRSISAGSNSRAAVARSRTNSAAATGSPAVAASTP